MVVVTCSDSIGRLAMATWRIGPPTRTISQRSWSVKTGEKFSMGSEMLSTSLASRIATSCGTMGELFSVTASARRTSSAASAAMMRRMS